MGDYPSRAGPYGGQGSSANLADILERVLDKGIVIAGDIQINLLDIELLTIKLRLLVASVDKAKEMGIDWWEHDPSLSSRASDGYRSLADENKRLRAEIRALREGDELPAAEEEDEEEYEYEDEDEGEYEGEAEAADEEEKPRPAARRATAARGTRAKRPEPRPRGKKRRDTS
ncbi:gas vesicle protein [Streptomyces sp. NPDC127097]|uniref:gas vesicle protein n=1 Tax=Streptomyces sp. NPDC127097 TaxID=3347136 RepID=UPI00366A2F07